MGPLSEILGESPALGALRDQVTHLLAHHTAGRRLPPVLILGETGTGKGLLARALHQAGPRAGGPLVALNCAAIPETLLEAELFGFEKGAFTDARQAKPGLFHTAHRGTLFLDEIGLLPLSLQSKLLTALEDRTVRRLGSTRPEPFDVWVLAAASVDVLEATRAGRFREELYHRLAVVSLRLPALRERSGDILLLAEHFLGRACADYGLGPKRLSDDARTALLCHRWPGNVRELTNVMERVALLTEGDLVTGKHLGLPAGVRRAPQGQPATPPRPADGEQADERARLEAALRETGWNVSRTAERLGLSRNALRYRIWKHGLHPEVAAARAPREAARGPEPQAPVPPNADPAAGEEPAGTAAPPELRVLETRLRWERRHIALLGADLTGPAGPDSPPDAAPALEVLLEKVQSFGGRVESVGPTHVTATFGILSAEDAVRRAAHAAVAIRGAAARGGEIGVVPVRLALHACEVLVGRLGTRLEIAKDDRRRAEARLVELLERAEPAAVVVSGEAAPLLERRFDLVELPSADGGLRAFRLGGPERTGLGLGGRQTRFVARQAEREVLERRWVEASRGRLAVVDVVGEAGVGKSRLVYEWRRGLPGERTLVLQGHCTADGRTSPFLPFIEVARSAFLIGDDDGPEAIAAKLGRGLEHLGLLAEDDLPFLQLLLGLEVKRDRLAGLDAETVGDRTREVLAACLRARCELSPVVLIVDDVHWIDSASQALLSRLVDGQSDVPLFLVMTRRPPYEPPRAGRPAVTELRLSPLPDEGCRQLLSDRLGGAAIADELARLVAEKAGGNPLFVEELARYLDERGLLVRTASGLAIRHGAEAFEPEGFRGLLLARVDQLPDGARAVLRLASVAGRRVPAELMRAAAPESDVDPHLRALEANELLVREKSDLGAEAYRFRHVLIRDAIYETLAAAEREALHLRVAEALERRYADRRETAAEELAHHYSRTSRADKEVRYLVLAGEKSLRVYSLEEADRYFQRAMELIEAAPGCVEEPVVADLVLAWADVYDFRNDYAGYFRLLEQYRPRLEKLGDARRLALLLIRLGRVHYHAARFDLARSVLKSARALGQAAGDQRSAGWAVACLMYVNSIAAAGEVRGTADKLRDECLLIAEAEADPFVLSECLHGLASYEHLRGRHREVRAACARLVELGRRTRTPRPVALGLRDMALVDLSEERYHEALERAQEAIRIGGTELRLMGTPVKGTVLTFLGRAGEGLEILRRAHDESIAGRTVVFLLRIDFGLGLALAHTGQVAAGVRFIEEAIERFTSWGNDTEPARGHMLLGELYLAMVKRELPVPRKDLLGHWGFALGAYPFAARRARRHLARALEMARTAEHGPFVARSLRGLGLLALATGDRTSAAAHLAEARRVAQPLGSPALVESIDRALEGLREPPARPQRIA